MSGFKTIRSKLCFRRDHNNNLCNLSHDSSSFLLKLEVCRKRKIFCYPSLPGHMIPIATILSFQNQRTATRAIKKFVEFDFCTEFKLPFTELLRPESFNNVKYEEQETSFEEQPCRIVHNIYVHICFMYIICYMYIS